MACGQIKGYETCPDKPAGEPREARERLTVVCQASCAIAGNLSQSHQPNNAQPCTHSNS